MDVREQGLTMLYLRLINMSNSGRRKAMDDYMDKWIEQVKTTERAIELVSPRGPSKRIPCR